MVVTTILYLPLYRGCTQRASEGNRHKSHQNNEKSESHYLGPLEPNTVVVLIVGFNECAGASIIRFLKPYRLGDWLAIDSLIAKRCTFEPRVAIHARQVDDTFTAGIDVRGKVDVMPSTAMVLPPIGIAETSGQVRPDGRLQEKPMVFHFPCAVGDAVRHLADKVLL